MSESGGKAKEIVLGDEFGDIAVKANGVRVEIHSDGSVDAYTKGAVNVHSPANDMGKTAAGTSVEPKIGDEMEDGTIYSGISPDTGKAMYTTPKDAATRRWLDNDKLTYNFNQAQRYAAKLEAHGHKDWRAPTKSELNLLFQNRAAIGRFDASGKYPLIWYWSSKADEYNTAWAQRFSDGHQSNFSKDYASSLRCVRG
jgi:hypothetical protein